jgi:hypothetical protein
VKVDEARGLPFWPSSQRAPKKKIIERGFIIRSFYNIYSFLLDQVFGEQAGLPRETLRRECGLEKAPSRLIVECGMRLAGQQ